MHRLVLQEIEKVSEDLKVEVQEELLQVQEMLKIQIIITEA